MNRATSSTTSCVPEQPAAQPSSDSSSSSDLESEGSSADDVQLLQSVGHSLALAASSREFQFLTTVKSDVVHVGHDRLLSGRTVFAGLKVTETVDFAKVQACLTCQSVSDGLIDGQWASTD